LSTWGHMDETYASGEGSDVWCNSDEPMAIAALVLGGYRYAAFEKISCFIIGKGGGNDPNIYLQEGTTSSPPLDCNIDANNNLFFVCS